MTAEIMYVITIIILFFPIEVLLALFSSDFLLLLKSFLMKNLVKQGKKHKKRNLRVYSYSKYFCLGSKIISWYFLLSFFINQAVLFEIYAKSIYYFLSIISKNIVFTSKIKYDLLGYFNFGAISVISIFFYLIIQFLLDMLIDKANEEIKKINEVIRGNG